jgi:pectinesterase
MVTVYQRTTTAGLLVYLILGSSWLVPLLNATELVVAADGSGDFLNVQDAVDAVPLNASTRTVIRIKPGTYREKIRVPQEAINLSLIGQSYENTILTFDDYAGKTPNYASTLVLADDFYAENITFQNTVDSRSGLDNGQAAALRIEGDRVVFFQCRIMGFQDTYYTGRNKRSYHKDCVIEGTTDFIYGDGIALFEDCTIINRKDSHITAHSQKLRGGEHVSKFGYVFLNCTIVKHAEEQVTHASLGRPWGNAARVVYLNCDLGEHIRAEGWSEWAGRENHQTAFFAEYNNRGPGYQPNQRLPWTYQLTDAQASEYTKQNIFRANTTSAVHFASDWNPDIKILSPQN